MGPSQKDAIMSDLLSFELLNILTIVHLVSNVAISIQIRFHNWTTFFAQNYNIKHSNANKKYVEIEQKKTRKQN